MFAHEQRIQKSEEILTILRHGKRSTSNSITCYFLLKPGSIGKVTVVVPVKVSKKATTRNLLKRRIRMLLRKIGLPQGDMVVRTFPGADKLSFPELEATLITCLSRFSSHA